MEKRDLVRLALQSMATNGERLQAEQLLDAAGAKTLDDLGDEQLAEVYGTLEKSHAGWLRSLTLPAPPADRRPSADDILQAATQHMRDRAAQRDLPDGERSMRRCVEAFNALTGHTLDEREGWLFMAVLKAARSCANPGKPSRDDYEDGAAYFGLAGEAALRDN